MGCLAVIVKYLFRVCWVPHCFPAEETSFWCRMAARGTGLNYCTSRKWTEFAQNPPPGSADARLHILFHYITVHTFIYVILFITHLSDLVGGGFLAYRLRVISHRRGFHYIGNILASAVWKAVLMQEDAGGKTPVQRVPVMTPRRE